MDITIGSLVGTVEFIRLFVNNSKDTLYPSAYTLPPRSAAVTMRIGVVVGATMVLPMFDDMPEVFLGVVLLFVKLHAGFM
jgi:hypothetical protein